MATFHPSLPRGARVKTTQNGTLEQIVLGPAHENDGSFNLMGGLRTSMATCGYEDIPSFHRAEVMVAPALQTEGKQLQRSQEIGMGATAAAAAAPPTADSVTPGNGGGPEMSTPSTDPVITGPVDEANAPAGDGEVAGEPVAAASDPARE
jgi:IMP dehydrogenase